MPLASVLSRDAARDFAREAFRSEERGIDWRSGCAGAVAAIGPLAVGLAVGDTVAGVTAALGGLNTALCVPRAGRRSRLWWGAVAAGGVTASLVLADLVGDQTWILLATTLAWVGGWAFLRAAGPRGVLVGFATCAVLVILAGLPVEPTPLGTRLWWFEAGALPGLALLLVVRRGDDPPGGVAGPALRAIAAGVRRDPALQGHALRLALAVGAATLVDRGLDLPHGYWVPLTVLAVLQPGEHATRVRAAQRVAGTLGGAALIIAITLSTGDRWALVACAAVAAFWLYALDERGYF